jgi:hypothetical protein
MIHHRARLLLQGDNGQAGPLLREAIPGMLPLAPPGAEVLLFGPDNRYVVVRTALEIETEGHPSDHPVVTTVLVSCGAS